MYIMFIHKFTIISNWTPNLITKFTFKLYVSTSIAQFKDHANIFKIEQTKNNQSFISDF